MRRAQKLGMFWAYHKMHYFWLAKITYASWLITESIKDKCLI